MAAARHKHMKKMHKAEGGAVRAGGNPDVMDEAEEKKKGGKVEKKLGKMHGKMPHKRLDRPGRKRGGRVGANESPLSTAHNSASDPSRPMANEGGIDKGNKKIKGERISSHGDMD